VSRRSRPAVQTRAVETQTESTAIGAGCTAACRHSVAVVCLAKLCNQTNPEDTTATTKRKVNLGACMAMCAWLAPFVAQHSSAHVNTNTCTQNPHACTLHSHNQTTVRLLAVRCEVRGVCVDKRSTTHCQWVAGQFVGGVHTLRTVTNPQDAHDFTRHAKITAAAADLIARQMCTLRDRHTLTQASNTHCCAHAKAHGHTGCAESEGRANMLATCHAAAGARSTPMRSHSACTNTNMTPRTGPAAVLCVHGSWRHY
jgi:hypothetical protein